MESTAIVLMLDSNNIGKNNSENCRRVDQNEKETEMEIDHSIVNNNILPLILTNNTDVNSLRQYYFSSFRKEMLWPSSNVILYELVLPGSISLQLDMNRLIPRVIATHTKRSKCSVAELLHTIVTLSLGKKSIELCLDKYLFSAMFNIGCETNDVITNLLQQFIMQILHYLSSKSMFDVHIPMKFLEILFQCINCESNFIIKDYVSICIKEFMQSMLNLLPKQDRQNSPIYHYTIHKIINLATYPSYNEPLTAAFAFNHLFNLCISPYLNMIVPNKYWLEFLHSFLMNIEKCHEKQVATALYHIKNTICSRTSIFNAKFPSRRKPSEFSNEKLEGAVIWLFEQCGNTSALLRCKCMKLFEDLCVHVSNMKSAKDFVDKYGIKNLNKIALKGLHDFEDLNMGNLKAFARTLDFYTWIFNREMTTPEVVFGADKNDKEKIIFLNIYGNFLSILISKNIEDTITVTTANTEEAKKMLELINAVLLKIIAFVSSIIVVTSVKNVIKNTWNDNLCLLITRVTLCPHKLGFSEQSLNKVEPQMLEKFFAIVSDNLPSVSLAKFYKNFFVDTQEELQNFSNVQKVMEAKNDLLSLQYFLDGITRLKYWEFINFEKQLKFTTAYIKEKITNIFVTLKSVTVDNNLKEDIDINVIQYLKGVLNFFLLSYKPELAEFMINLVSNEFSSTNGTASTIIFNTFKQPILEFLLKNPLETLNMLNAILLPSPEKLLLLLESLLVHATSNPNENSKVLADNIIKGCSSHKDLILDIQYHDWVFKIIRQAVLLSSDPSTTNEDPPSPLIPYILEEFDKAESAVKRIEVVDEFIKCFINSSRTSKSHIITMFKKLKEERLQAPQQLNALINKLAAMKSWIIWEGIILLTCGACDHFFKDNNLVKHIETYFSGMSSEDASNKIESIYAIFKDTSFSPEERLDLLSYFLVPSINSCHIVTALNNFYENNFQDLYILIVDGMNELDIVLRKHSLINKIASYRLFEIMYAKLPFSVILGFQIDQNPKDYLNICLLRHSHEVRHFTAIFDEEKELARLLHCSALNSYIAMVSLQIEKTFQNSIFKEVSIKNQLVWEKIIDCEKKYEFLPSAPEVKLINVMRKNGDRMRLSLEKDELNDHECMEMIVGIFLYMHDNKSVQARDTLPDWMVHFHEAFNTDKDNVILYLLRVIVNARRAFLPCMHLFFESVAKAICFYLRENKINYLIRDVLLMILETEGELKSESEIQAGQCLIQNLIQQAQDLNISICEYNVEIIEKLAILWKSRLKVPANLDTLMQSHQMLAIRIILMLLKQNVHRHEIAYNSEVQAIVRNRMFRWREPLSPQIVEILGYMVSCIPEQERDRTVKKSLVPMFTEMRRAGSADFCAHMFYLIFIACPSLAKHEDLLTFINPVGLENDEIKAECFEMFLETRMDLEPSIMYEKLECMKFMELLSDKTMMPCVEVGFKIIDKLVLVFNAQQLLPYARVVEKYARKDALLEHKSNAIWFFIGVYKKYVNDVPEERDEHTNNLLTLSEQVLINDVSDPSDEMQEEVLDFWRDSPQLTENTVDRLKRILDMFSLEVHSSYAQFLCLLMLDLTNKYSDNQKLLFGPLTPCNYESQEVVVPRKSRSKAPIQRTPQGQKKTNSLTHVDDSARKKIVNVDVKLSKRTFPSNEEIDEYAFLYPVVTRNYAAEYNEKLQSQKLEQENFIKFNRTYKETYLPDVEINQADVVATIEDYAKRCPSYAADLSVSIVCGMLDHFKGTETYNEIMESLANMCKKALKKANDFAPAVMEILYKCNCSFDVDDLVKISISMDLQSLGILILEKKAIIYDYADLYRTGKKIASELELNVHLAMLYRSINEFDVVESIFKNWSLDSALDFLREGSTAEAEMEWSTAKEAYKEGFNDTNGVVKDYCMEGMFECLSKLSSWSEINKTIETIVQDKDYNSVWRHPNKEQLLPWMFKAQLQEKLENLFCDRDSESEFSNRMDAWLNEKGDSITRPFGEELSLFFLCNGDSITARKCLDSCLQSIREKWTLGESNQQVLDKFKRLNEIKLYMDALEKDPLDGTRELLNHWEANVPGYGDDLLNWNVQLNYRLTFASLLSNWLADVSMDSGIVSDLAEVGVKQRLLVNDTALKYKNKAVARKFSLQIRKDLKDTDPEDESFQKLRNQFKLSSFRYAYLCYENNTDLDRRFSYLISSWHGAINLYQEDKIDVSLEVKICHHIFELTKAFRSWILINDTVAWKAIEDEFISQELNADTPEELDNSLFKYSFNTLKDICEKGNAKEMAESYTKFAEYCQKLMIDVYDREDALQKEFLFSLLKAMSFGSARAARYFPCLLKHSIYRDNEPLSKLFIERCQAIPSRMFLDWQEEIILHLATPLAPQVLPIVEKLCNDFPSAIILNLRKVRTNPMADELYNSMFTDSKYDTFFCAMEYLCQPEEYLRHRLQEFICSIDNNEVLSEAVKLLSKVTTNATLQSAEFKKVLNNSKKEFEKLTSISDVTVARKAAEQLRMDLRKAMAQRLDKNELTESTKLSYYSPFLNDFTERDFDVDVPIQYNALQQRPKIVRIDRFVRIVPSKSSPLVMKIVGSDGKTYEFLVKCGIDLRQIQKMQRIFKIANEILNDDLNCCNRHLLVSTYNVVPISSSTGLVQWISNVKSLEEIVEFSLRDKSIIQSVKEKYQVWINDACKDKVSSKSIVYKHALVKYSTENVSKKMIELTTDIKPNLIQRTFLQISLSLDSYFKLRQNFIKNYATMCLTHWLFGVGDRRMKNILVDIFNSNCFGINFDLIFGAAAELPIPELVPFRLTGQIINFMKPFGERDLFGATMCHVLKALKNEINLIIGCLEAFLQESIKWNVKLNLLWKNDDAAYNGVEWSPLGKIEIIKQKLRGVKPSKILTDELSRMHEQNETRYFPLYKMIVNGNERYHTTVRSLVKDYELAPEEQVLCLLDQATDVNTVGRMWADWKCFV